MTPDEWLARYAPDYPRLTPELRDSIMHFALLWSFMESTVFGCQASVPAIIRGVEDWQRTNKLSGQPWQSSLQYFQSRYVTGSNVNRVFAGLRFGNQDDRRLVASVLTGRQQGVSEVAKALLLIVHRLRNNLFHGEKWADPLEPQLNNFQHANRLMMLAIDTHEGRAP